MPYPPGICRSARSSTACEELLDPLCMDESVHPVEPYNPEICQRRSIRKACQMGAPRLRPRQNIVQSCGVLDGIRRSRGYRPDEL